jgi:hypothetical protein
VLKQGVWQQRNVVIEHIFHTCCALHNFLLERAPRRLNGTLLGDIDSLRGRLYHPQEAEYFYPAPARVEDERECSRKRQSLICHFAYMFEKNKILWPRCEDAGFLRRHLDSFGDEDAETTDFVDDSL